MVSTWTASASDSSRRLRSSLAVSCPAWAIRSASQAARAETPSWPSLAASWRSCPTWRRSVMVRSPSRSARIRAARPVPAATVSRSAATPRRRRTAPRRWRLGVKLLEVGVVDLGEARGRPAEEPGQRRRGGEARRGGELDRPQQAQPLVGGAGAEDASRAVDDRGDADLGEGVAHEGGLAIGGHENRQVPRDGPAPDGRLPRSRRERTGGARRRPRGRAPRGAGSSRPARSRSG